MTFPSLHPAIDNGIQVGSKGAALDNEHGDGAQNID